MKKYSIFARFLQYVLLAAFVPSALSVSAIASLTPRSVLSADADWKFLLGDPAGAELSGYDDHLWRTVTVPHDWSIEGVPAEGNSTGTGGGYYPAGIGWYRKTFTAPAAWSGKRVSLEFDGISMNATVFLNGHKLGFHPYAYTSFRLDITNQVNLSTKNVLAVRVDNAEQPNSRWYSGSGIYRHVRVVVTEPIHIAPWGVFVSTPEASAASARVIVRTQVQNDTEKAESVTVKSVIVSPLGTKSREVRGSVHLESGQAAETTQQVLLEEPRLWSPEHPRLYRVLTQVIKNGTILDQSESQSEFVPSHGQQIKAY